MVLGVWLGVGMGWAAEAPVASFPCQNGWAQCRKGALTIDGRPIPDGSGMPNPADARLGWFDLNPTPGFDPFDAGSDDGEALALVDLSALASPAPKDTPKEARIPQTHRAERAVVAPVVQEERIVEPVMPEPRVVEPVSAPAERSCEGPEAYEVWAKAGRLDAFQAGCLARTVREGTRMRTRIHASLALIADARARQDAALWATRTATHLEQLDRSDARLCRSYASWAERNGRPLAAIRWSEVALENRHQWSGSEHVQATADLYATRARAANTLWMRASGAWQANPTTDAAHTERDARNRAKSFARAWLDYVRAAEQPVSEALALCTSTAGTQAYCTE